MAGLGWRVGARVVDVVVFVWLTVFVLVEIDQRLLGGDPWGRRTVGIELDSARPIALLVVLVIAYEIVPTAVAGVTPGKLMFGLRIRRSPADRVPAAVAWIARAVVLYLPVIFAGPYGPLVPAMLLVSTVVPRSGRGLHDRLAGTRVVGIAAGRQ